MEPKDKSGTTYPRPCIVYANGGPEKGLLHGFFSTAEVVGPSLMRGGHPGGQLADVFALVEFEDGHMGREETRRIAMLDSDQVFSGFRWDVLVQKHMARYEEGTGHG